MSVPIRRLASLILSAASCLLPPHLSVWARAMERELAEIAGDRAALGFAVGCLRGALTLAIAARLRTFGLPVAAWPFLSPPSSGASGP